MRSFYFQSRPVVIFFSLLLPWLLSGCAGLLYQQNSLDINQLFLANQMGKAQQLAADIEKREPVLGAMFAGEVAWWHEKSNQRYLDADKRVQIYENLIAQSFGDKLEKASQLLSNDYAKTYTGQDFERVALNSRLALSHLANNRFDLARVEAKKLYEREAIIARQHQAEAAALQKTAASDAQTIGRQVPRYPEQAMQSPAVLALTNAYQSAIGHYVVGYVFESLQETSLAMPGYRQALALQPNNPVIEQAIENLDKPLPENTSDVLIIIDRGLVPQRQSMQFNLQPIGGSLIAISLPVIPSQPALPNIALDINGVPHTPHMLTHYGAMAVKTLSDDLPAIALRSIARATARAMATSAIAKDAKDNDKSMVNFIGSLAGLVLEQADVRAWSTLPLQTEVVRLRLPFGQHAMTFATTPTVRFDIRQARTLLWARQLGNQTLWLGNAKTITP